jgi:hypothetical protein
LRWINAPRQGISDFSFPHVNFTLHQKLTELHGFWNNSRFAELMPESLADKRRNQGEKRGK